MKRRTVFPTVIRYTHTAAAVALLIAIVVASPSSHAQTYTVLHTFTNVPDGLTPNPLIRDGKGIMYGTTYAGGADCGAGSCGMVYKIDSSGQETVLYRFQGGADGRQPLAALIRDAAGNLYGNTQGDGDASTVFKIDPSGKETVLYRFTQAGHGCCQDSPLALDKAGNLDGMSPYDGDYNCGYQQDGCGVLYRLTQAGKQTLLHTFEGADGITPYGGLVVGLDGSLYGTAMFGGILSCITAGDGRHVFNKGCGTIYKVDSSGKFTVLRKFTGKADGGGPLGLIQDPQGNLYGIGDSGGGHTRYGYGTIFKVDTHGKFTVLYRFTSEIGTPRFGSLIRDSKGNLYGVNQYGGANNTGFIFKLSPSSEFSIVASFPSDVNKDYGIFPQGIVMDSSGNFYGTMADDGAFLCGTVFKVTP